MKKHYHDLFCFQSLLLIHLVLNRTTAFDFQCPSLNQWMLRARSHCVITDGYICLFDVNRNDFGEICRNKSYFESPGYKFVIVGNLDRRKCESTRYQPFTFSTNGRKTCIFEKTFCSEEGQIISNNGSTKVDRQCRCDYTRGYDFITKPNNGCYCVPSMEDCSCYQKPCPLGFILNPDYQCVNLSIWNSQSTCESILPERSRNTIFPLDDKNTDDSPTASERNVKVVLGIVTVITIIVGLFIVVITTLSVPKLDAAELQEHLKQQWEERFCHFIATRASNKIKEKMLTEQCVLISGPHGCGKSSSAFHIAMELVKTLEYDCIIISKPDDLLIYASEDRKQLFLIDDVFGKYFVSDYNIMWWNHHGNFIQGILRQNKNFKILMTSRLHIYRSVNLEQLKITFCHINLISDEILLTLEERINIGRCYIKNDIDNLAEKLVMSYSWYPALCANFRDNKEVAMDEYFALPVAYIMSEIENIRKSKDLFYIALSIMIICDNKVSKEIFNEDKHKSYDMLTLVSKEIGYGGNPSLALLFSHFISLKGTYVLEKKHAFECLHLNLFYTLTFCIAPRIMRSIFMYGKSSFINARMQLETRGADYPTQTIMVPKALQIVYFERILHDINEGLFDTFSGYQHVFLEFRESFMAYLKNHLKDADLKQGRHATTILHVVSAEGYDDYANFFLGFNKAMINLQDNLGQTALHKACIKGYKKVTQLLLENGAFIASTDNDGKTALDIACDHGFTDTVQLLLSHQAPIHQKRTDLKSALHVACSNNNLKIAELLLQSKAKLNEKDTHGLTPLHLACRKGHVNIVKLLIDYKSDVNIADHKLRTALFFACKNGHLEIAKILLFEKANVNKENELRNTPLLIACKNNHNEVIKLLLEHESDVDCKNKSSLTPLHFASTNNNKDIVSLLIDHKAKINERDKTLKTPLFLACTKTYAVAGKLLHNEASKTKANQDGQTPYHLTCKDGTDHTVSGLSNVGANNPECNKNMIKSCHWACEGKPVEIVKELLNAGANVNDSDENGMTPFHKACEAGDIETINVLLNAGAKVDKVDKNGRTPLHMACTGGNVETVRVLLKASANVNVIDKDNLTPLHMAGEAGDIETVSVLLNAGAYVNEVDKNGKTPLHLACDGGHVETVNVLLKAGSNVNESDKDGITPLHMACSGGHVETVNVLLKAGSNVNEDDKDGITPLHLACKGTNVETGKRLFNDSANLMEDNHNAISSFDPCEEVNEETIYDISSTGVDVNEGDKDMIAPLQMTCPEGREEIVALLLSAGADVNRGDKDGITSLQIAYTTRNKRIADLLLVKT
ncbi:unnamed protein product [Mytilus coruscus]|uniref:Novel STAND NTPase 3 domain-containing protein n=1 Tax=Mytilus coruscus TaxID=42192 RepID=A0A6J7ZYJ7_MYTCO|nr:unnamed protein product [Mytilus coruscus]